MRGEYRWRGGVTDWQISLEGALNRLDIVNDLFELNPLGDFRARRPSPTAPRPSRKGAPRRCSPMAGPLTPTLTLQASLGGEYSQLSQEGAGGLTRDLLPAQGLPQPRLAAAARLRHQRPDRARRRPAQLLRFRRLGQRLAPAPPMPATPIWCRRRAGTRRSRRAAISAAGARSRRALYGRPDHRHRRRHPDRRERPVAGQSRRHGDDLRPAMDEHVQLRSDRLARRQARRQHPVPAHRARPIRSPA